MRFLSFLSSDPKIVEAEAPYVSKDKFRVYGAKRAIDGNRKTNFTSKKMEKPWILLKLADLRTITGLHMYSSVYPGELKINVASKEPDRDVFKAKVEATDEVVFNLHINKNLESQTVTFLEPKNAQYIVIQSQDRKVLMIQEAVVFDSSGKYHGVSTTCIDYK